MTKVIELERYLPESSINFSFSPSAVTLTTLEAGGRVVPHLETPDFPVEDPWSVFFRSTIARLRNEGAFIGKEVNEGGIGDGRNILEAGHGIAGVLGLDIEYWRVGVASVNLSPKGLALPNTELWRADAVDFLQESKRVGRTIKDWMVLCLPQSPEGLNYADRYDVKPNLKDYRGEWGDSGLTLNAAVLDNLRQVADANLRTLIILSDRVPDAIRNEMFRQTGWVIERQIRTQRPIQQDPDTGISWVAKIDDGNRFHEKDEKGFYRPILATEAERRRFESFTSGGGRKDLNVYHDLTVYQVRQKNGH